MRLGQRDWGLQKLWKRLGVVLGCLGLAGFMWTAALWNQQLRTLPRAPDQEAGSIYPRNIHGIVVYQTRSQRDYLERIQDGSIAVFVVSFLMSLIYKKKWGPEPSLGPPKVGTGWHPK